jgi:type IV pilus assembly protein PilB
MVDFDNEKSDKKVDEIRKDEEERLVETLARDKYHMPSINLASVPIENGALQMIPETTAIKLHVGPFKLLGKHLHIAVLSPDNTEVAELKSDLTRKGYVPSFYMASHSSLKKILDRYKELSLATASRAGGLDISGETLADIIRDIHHMNDVKNMITETQASTGTHKVSKILEIILAGAISLDVSDIHIEPEEEMVRVRFRLDGVLQDILFIDKETHHLINSRLKLISGMKLSQSSVAQDGRFSIFMSDGTEISMRVSIIPGAYGESFVMRILNPKSIQVKLEEMGIEPRLFEVIEKEIGKPNGMILITGPTGSGKTTTLYAFLQKIYSPEIKILTIEDPVEYHLKGITQTQTDSEKGYSFLEGLRAGLRQDPDVIMVGEIRDSETAKIAVESALTGHLVFSTLHTNNAAGVIPRLIDLEVNPKILVSALSLSMAQRLVRKLCQFCKVERPTTEKEEKLMHDILALAEKDGKNLSFYNITASQVIKLYKAVGCEKCNMTGYKGRIGIFEAIKTDEAIEKIIPQNPSEREIKRIARAQGIFDMREDGVAKILSGITSIEEVQSVVDLSEE